MLTTPDITHIDPEHTAVIRVTIPRKDIQTVMGPGIRELMAAIAAQGIAPTGPWFTHHLRMDPTVFDFEIGIPVAAPVTAAGRVTPSSRPAMRAARAVYQGAYEGLGPAWGKLDAWVTDTGHTPGRDLWECYVAGPDSSADPTDWRTELVRPLVTAP